MNAAAVRFKKPAAGFPARALKSRDDEDMPVICPTCQIHLGAGRLNERAVNFVGRSFVQRKLFFPPDSIWNGPAAESGGRFRP
jgi:hypothetical protein